MNQSGSSPESLTFICTITFQKCKKIKKFNLVIHCSMKSIQKCIKIDLFPIIGSTDFFPKRCRQVVRSFLPVIEWSNFVFVCRRRKSKKKRLSLNTTHRITYWESQIFAICYWSAQMWPTITSFAHDGLLLTQPCVVVIKQQHTVRKEACAPAHEGIDTEIWFCHWRCFAAVAVTCRSI